MNRAERRDLRRDKGGSPASERSTEVRVVRMQPRAERVGPNKVPVNSQEQRGVGSPGDPGNKSQDISSTGRLVRNVPNVRNPGESGVENHTQIFKGRLTGDDRVASSDTDITHTAPSPRKDTQLALRNRNRKTQVTKAIAEFNKSSAQAESVPLT